MGAIKHNLEKRSIIGTCLLMAFMGAPNHKVKALLDEMGQEVRIRIQGTPQCWTIPTNCPSTREHTEVIYQ